MIYISSLFTRIIFSESLVLVVGLHCLSPYEGVLQASEEGHLLGSSGLFLGDDFSSAVQVGRTLLIFGEGVGGEGGVGGCFARTYTGGNRDP